ncbi:helix-turn-helix domain-containing protein [Desulfarculus baarsii]
MDTKEKCLARKDGSETLFSGIGARLQAIRKQIGLSQAEMDGFLGIGKRSWQRYENGINTPGGQVIVALVEQGFNANWLLSGKGSMLLNADNASESADCSRSDDPDLRSELEELKAQCAVPVVALIDVGMTKWFVNSNTSLKTSRPENAPYDVQLFAVLSAATVSSPYGIRPNSLLFCTPELQPQSGQLVYVLRVDNLATTGVYWEGSDKDTFLLDMAVNNEDHDEISLTVRREMVSKIAVISFIKQGL